MPHQKHLSKAQRQQSYQCRFSRAFAWIIALATLFLSAFAIAEPASAACRAKILSSEVSKADPQDPAQSDDQWQPVELSDYQWTTRWPLYSGGAWYRLRWQADCDDDNSDDQTLAIAVKYLNSAGAIYLNDALLFRDESLVEPLSQSQALPRFLAVPKALIRQDNYLDIYVVSIYQKFQPGLGKVIIAPYDEANQIYEQWRLQNFTLPWSNIIMSLATGLPWLFVWLCNRRVTVFGWYAASSLSWVLLASMMYTTSLYFLPNTLALVRAVNMLLPMVAVFFYTFLYRFCERRFPVWERLQFIAAGMSSLAFLLIPEEWIVTFSLILLLSLLVITLGNFVFFIIHTWRNPRHEYIITAISLIGFIVVFFHDIYIGINLRETDHIWFSYATIGSVLAMSFIFSVYSRRIFRQLRDYNTRLEQEIVIAKASLRQQMLEQENVRLENTLLQERLRVSHELHDGIGSSIIRSIAEIERQKDSVPNHVFLALLKLLRDDLRQVIDNAFGESSVTPETPVIWMAPSRQRFNTLFDALDISASWSIPSSWQTRPQPVLCLTLSRILEECLTNIIKHSRASLVQVTVRQNQSALFLSITDNGVGFDVGAVKRSGLSVGLSSIQRRCARQNGHVWIYSRPGKTRLALKFNLADNKDNTD
ncbi:hypothetical protein KRX19_10490 [Cardiobacteriaceae bacterium TAE3-ERU3]|nr:hypothetical protein [Cardiobacteriaceae bacterium TAE3-ERU3]